MIPRIYILRCALLGSLLLTCCSHTMKLQPVRAVPPEQTHSFLPEGSRVFVDDIVKIHVSRYRIGKKRTSAAAYWADIKTRDDITAWADIQWRHFLTRHNTIPVDSYQNADYIITSTIQSLWVEKKWEALWGDEFFGKASIDVKITHLPTGTRVFDRTVKGVYSYERPSSKNREIPDEQIFNRCLAAAFQTALETIVIP